MQTAAILTLFLVASVAAATSPQEHQPSVAASSSSSASSPDQSVANVQASPSVVVQSPGGPVPPPQVVEAAPPAPVAVEPVAPHHQHQAPAVHQHQHHQGPNYYAPAGIIQVEGQQPGQQVVPPKPGSPAVAPAGPVRQFGAGEQYGQPESASIPPNYKPFGSWGLYIGGNPADGYYTNYYKQLAGSVEKQQQQQQSQVTPAAALSPMLRQASSSPYVGADFYPFAYSPAELNTGAAIPRPYQPLAYAPGASFAPDSDAYPSSYADQAGATKRLGSSYPTKQVQQQEVREVTAPKGHLPQSPRYFVYPPQAVGQMSAPVSGFQHEHHHQRQQQSQQQQQPQVVAYPVPVGSQIVGSQQGVDGAFAPYGVHAFTRYAVKPAVVGGQSEPNYYHAQQQQGVYKQQQVSYYPQAAYYGHPGQQLHYAPPGPVGPAVYGGEHAHFGHPSQPEFVGDKVVEAESDKMVNVKPQN